VRFTLDHPTDRTTRAVLGHDRTAVGYFLEVRRAGKLVHIFDGLRSGPTTIQGVLSRLMEHGFVTEDDLHEAMQMLPHMDAADIQDPDLRRAAEVIERLRGAASKG